MYTISGVCIDRFICESAFDKELGRLWERYAQTFLGVLMWIPLSRAGEPRVSYSGAVWKQDFWDTWIRNSNETQKCTGENTPLILPEIFQGVAFGWFLISFGQPNGILVENLPDHKRPVRGKPYLNNNPDSRFPHMKRILKRE